MNVHDYIITAYAAKGKLPTQDGTTKYNYQENQCRALWGPRGKLKTPPIISPTNHANQKFAPGSLERGFPPINEIHYPTHRSESVYYCGNFHTILIYVGGTTWQVRLQLSAKLIFIGGTTTKIRKPMKISRIIVCDNEVQTHVPLCNPVFAILTIKIT